MIHFQNNFLPSFILQSLGEIPNIIRLDQTYVHTQYLGFTRCSDDILNPLCFKSRLCAGIQDAGNPAGP